MDDAERIAWSDVEAAAGRVFDAAPEERARVFDEVCGSNPDLARRVRALLHADETCGDFLDRPAADHAGSLSVRWGQGEAAHHPDVPGYRIIRQLGRGGMGEVFLATPAELGHPFVAVKILRSDVVDDAVRARFLQERRILAQLRHHHVAALFGSGMTGDRPYFVMEYVDGEPITTYCDRCRLGIDDRVRLFLGACLGAGHAHRHRIVHRDLKPSNILVSLDAEAKLLDFGIAKCIESLPGALEDVPVTRSAQRVLTPQYASPEQIRGGAIGPASDVFSLGVVLYELLTGHHPFAAFGWTLGETERAILDREPRPPSEAVTQTQDVVTPQGGRSRIHPEIVARARDTLPERLPAILRGALDAVVRKTLEKDPARRYPDADRLARDLERYLASEPVAACRQSPWRRAGSWVRAKSHRGAETERARVEDLRESAHQARRADAIMNFLVRMFELAAPTSQGNPDVRARDMLDWAVANVETELANEPDARVDLLTTLGRIYGEAGDAERASLVLTRALEEARRWCGSHDARLVAVLRYLGTAFQELARYEEAERYLGEALGIAREVYGERHLEVASRMNDLAILYDRRGDPRGARSMHEEALAIKRLHLDDDDVSVLSTLNNLGVLLQRMGYATEAQHLLAEVLAARRRLYGNENVYVANALHNLMVAHRRRGDHGGAAPLARAALELRKQLLGPDHPDVAASAFNLASIFRDTGRLDEAEPLFRTAIDISTRGRGSDHVDTIGHLTGLALLQHRRGDSEEGENLLGQCCARMESVLGPTHPQVANVRLDLARLLLDRGRHEEASRLAERVAEVRAAHFGFDTPLAAEARAVLARCWFAAGRGEPACAALQTAIPILESAWAADHPEIRQGRALLAGWEAQHA